MRLLSPNVISMITAAFISHPNELIRDPVSSVLHAILKSTTIRRKEVQQFRAGHISSLDIFGFEVGISSRKEYTVLFRSKRMLASCLAKSLAPTHGIDAWFVRCDDSY